MRDLARRAVEIVDTVCTRVITMDEKFIFGSHLESPRLSIVSARRPTGHIENLFD